MFKVGTTIIFTKFHSFQKFVKSFLNSSSEIFFTILETREPKIFHLVDHLNGSSYNRLTNNHMVQGQVNMVDAALYWYLLLLNSW